MITYRLSNHRLYLFTSFSTFFFFALTFAIPSGYSYGFALLLLASFFYFFTEKRNHLSVEDKTLAYILLALCLAAISAFFIHQNDPKTLDQSSRYLLFIPILLLILRVSIAPTAVWGGLAIGTLSALTLALWQRFSEGNLRPDGYMTSAIPFGNLSLTAGVLCIAGITWSGTRTRHALHWRIVLYAGFLAGLYVSLVSGSRGGWLATPAVITIFGAAFLRKGNLKRVMFSTLLIVPLLLALGLAMQDQIVERYQAAATEMHEYAESNNSATSIGLRLEAWKAAMASIAEEPLLGWSYQDYSAHVREMAINKKVNASITTLANTHNNFLEVWLHQGLFGFLAFLALFTVPFWFFCKRLRSNDRTVQAFALGGACLLASFFIFSLTQVILGRNNGVIFFGLSLVIFWGGMRNAEQRTVKLGRAT